MSTSSETRRHTTRANCAFDTRPTGFSLIELLIGISLLAIALLAIATMFSTGYSDVHAGGKATMATAAARQMLEDIRSLPFDRLGNLNNFDTTNAATLPAANPERDLARKWRYALAGETAGWPAYTAAEKAMWSALTISGVQFGANGQITVAQVNPTLRRVTVTVRVPGRTAGEQLPIRLATLITRL